MVELKPEVKREKVEYEDGYVTDGEDYFIAVFDGDEVIIQLFKVRKTERQGYVRARQRQFKGLSRGRQYKVQASSPG